jgi:hypothetical protein
MELRKAASMKVCVLYDPDSGHIRHVHKTIVLPGAKMPSASAIESSARSSLNGHHAKPPKVKALHVPEADLKSRSRFKVDPAKRKLVEMPRD